MNLINPTIGLLLWQLISIALFLFILFIAIKFTLILFKADKAIDELRTYMRRRS
ncbi:hypothetical protein [Spirosoma areae]